MLVLLVIKEIVIGCYNYWQEVTETSINIALCVVPFMCDLHYYCEN